MNRVTLNHLMAAALIAQATVWAACSAADGKTKDRDAAVPPAVSVAPTAAVERPIARFIRVTGTLMAEERADV
ncbi:MAG: hypothetical protein DMF91_27935, partial [Acidobacteria bacterium]